MDNLIPKKKPPLGVVPRDMYERAKKKARYQDICGAIKRAYEAGTTIHIEWVIEYNELIQAIKPYG